MENNDFSRALAKLTLEEKDRLLTAIFERNRRAVLGETVCSNDAETLKLLILLGVDVHEADDYELCNAAKLGCLETVKVLIENGANVRTKCDYPLQIAVKNNHFEIAELILKAMKK